MFLLFGFPLFKEFGFGVGGAFDPVKKLGEGVRIVGGARSHFSIGWEAPESRD